MAIQKSDRKRARAVMKQFEADEAKRMRQRTDGQPASTPPDNVDTVNN